MAHVDPPSARSPETQKERLTPLLREARQLRAFVDDLIDVGGEERKGPYSAEAKWHNVKVRAAVLVDHLAALAADPRQGEAPLDPAWQMHIGAIVAAARDILDNSTGGERTRAQAHIIRGEAQLLFNLIANHQLAAPARTVQAEPAPQATGWLTETDERICLLPRIKHEGVDYINFAAVLLLIRRDAYASLGRETRVPHPPEPACTNCGELAKPSHYVDFVGPFCQGCWTHLKEYFAARQETPAVPPASALVQTARKLAGEFIAHVTQKAVRYPGAPIILTMKEAQHLAAAFSLVLPSSVSAPERTQ